MLYKEAYMSNPKKNKTKKIVIIVTAVVLVAALCTTMLVVFRDKLFPSGSDKTESKTKTAETAKTYSEQAAAFSNGNYVSFEQGFTDTKVIDAQSAMAAISEVDRSSALDDPANRP